MVLDMFKRFETYDSIEQILAFDWDLLNRAFTKFEIAFPISFTCVFHRILVDIDPNNSFRIFGKKKTPISLAARKIQYDFSCNKLRYKRIPMQVLIVNFGSAYFRINIRQISLASPFQHFRTPFVV
ncbi:hypothetical protein SZ63_07505 [Methanoculleus sediminis]|uniref:Uncharacterized protein n=1 Tax=Methanoculleus sediminis TaxID=1550566 RepID=A0A0H1R1A2_9EURY|nr:hypothetical protein SZ63_07505 [Methanoculleus sediminis]